MNLIPENGLYLGDGLVGLERLPQGCVDLVLSDLPSGATEAEFDVKPDFDRFWGAAWSALKPSGNVVVMASSMLFAIECIQSQPKAFRYDLVWNKDKSTGFLNSKTRPLRSHEFILVFFGEQGTFNPQMVETGIAICKNSTPGRSHGENYGKIDTRKGLARKGATDRYPRSVLEYECLSVQHPTRTHPQQKPNDLFRDLVRSYSNAGDLVVDPYAGSGTTLRAAADEGRRAVGWEIQERFAVRQQLPLIPDLIP